MEIKHKILGILLRVDAGTTTPLKATKEILFLFNVREKKVKQIENKKNNESLFYAKKLAKEISKMTDEEFEENCKNLDKNIF